MASPVHEAADRPVHPVTITIDAAHPGPYTDTPTPRVFGAVSPLDPQLFSRINDFADDLITGARDGKFTPVYAWVNVPTLLPGSP